MHRNSKLILQLFAIAGTACLFCAGCAPKLSAADRLAAARGIGESQLAARERQTREYDGITADGLLKVALNVLQDEGYSVTNAVPQLGLIAAVRDVDITDSDESMFKSFMFGEDARWDQHARVEATINTTNTAGRARIRATFRVSISDNAGKLVSIEEIAQPEFYKDFFAKIDKGIYLYREKL